MTPATVPGRETTRPAAAQPQRSAVPPAPPPSRPRGLLQSAAANTESVLVIAGLLYRGYGLSQVIIPLWLGWSQFPSPQLALWFVVAIVAESMIVAYVCLAARVVPARLIAFDVAWSIGALFLGTRLTWVHSGEHWINFMYPYTVIGAVLIGFAHRRYPIVFVLTTVLAAGYAIADILPHHDSALAAIPNTLGYYANTTAGYLVAWYMRRVGREFDASRANALARAEAVARAGERARHARMLHDRVLQTLETLSRGNWIRDAQFRQQIAAETAWLRGLVEGAGPTDGEEPDDLLAGLRQLVCQRTGAGLHVELNIAQLCDSDQWRARLPADTAAALVDAAYEALTNVAKHSGVAEAIVRASVSDRELTVSVLDQGCGFDPDHVQRGVGLTESIGSRIREVGGRVCVDSSPGAGTCVELSVPLS